MGIINDMAKKAAHWKPIPPISIYAEDHAEKLMCSICGKQYVSRGKYDPGICRECERERNAHCVGGVYDGEPAHKNHEEN